MSIRPVIVRTEILVTGEGDALAVLTQRTLDPSLRQIVGKAFEIDIAAVNSHINCRHVRSNILKTTVGIYQVLTVNGEKTIVNESQKYRLIMKKANFWAISFVLFAILRNFATQ